MKNLLYFFSILVVLSCDTISKPKLTLLHGDAFGTTYSIQFYSDEHLDAEKGLDSVIYAINKSVSTYMPNSDISKVNRGDSTLVVDAIFKEVFKISEVVYKNSVGYFDPTIGVLRNAYGFGDTATIALMDQKTIDSLMNFVGFHKIGISEKGTVVKQRPEIYIDFNAVAKGYGIDCIGRYLDSEGIDHYLIELGGEILAKGENLSKGKPWVVGIETVNSDLDDRSFQASVYLDNKAMASSGNYRKFRIDSISGKKFVHTLNPLTGSAEQSDITSATVIANSCGEADAYATALMAMGLEKSKAMLIAISGIEAYLTYTDSLNNSQLFISEGFKKYLVDSLATHGN